MTHRIDGLAEHERAIIAAVRALLAQVENTKLLRSNEAAFAGPWATEAFDALQTIASIARAANAESVIDADFGPYLLEHEHAILLAIAVAQRGSDAPIEPFVSKFSGTAEARVLTRAATRAAAALAGILSAQGRFSAILPPDRAIPQEIWQIVEQAA
jgi:hypothetical protein